MPSRVRALALPKLMRRSAVFIFVSFRFVATVVARKGSARGGRQGSYIWSIFCLPGGTRRTAAMRLPGALVSARGREQAVLDLDLRIGTRETVAGQCTGAAEG